VVKVDTVNQLERSVLGSTAGGLAVLHPDVICGRRLLRDLDFKRSPSWADLQDPVVSLLPTRYSSVKLVLTETKSVTRSETALAPVGIGMANNVLFEVSSNVLTNDVQLSAVALLAPVVWLKLAGRPVVLLIPRESLMSSRGEASADDAVKARERARVDRMVKVCLAVYV
jgi:hypothetical protein